MISGAGYNYFHDLGQQCNFEVLSSSANFTRISDGLIRIFKPTLGLPKKGQKYVFQIGDIALIPVFEEFLELSVGFEIRILDLLLAQGTG